MILVTLFYRNEKFSTEFAKYEIGSSLVTGLTASGLKARHFVAHFELCFQYDFFVLYFAAGL